jgi:hypothetical protein
MNNEKKTNNENKNNNEYKEEKIFSNHNDNGLLRKYIHDIRNSKIFSKDILHDMNNLSYEDRMEILVTYNEIISYYVSLFDDK